MTKRKTKAQREADQLAALEQRITDIYAGAAGTLWGDDEFATAETLSQVVPAIRAIFGADRPHEFCFSLRCLNHFDTPSSAARFLFTHGYRADSWFEDDEEDDA